MFVFCFFSFGYAYAGPWAGLDWAELVDWLAG